MVLSIYMECKQSTLKVTNLGQAEVAGLAKGHHGDPRGGHVPAGAVCGLVKWCIFVCGGGGKVNGWTLSAHPYTKNETGLLIDKTHRVPTRDGEPNTPPGQSKYVNHWNWRISGDRYRSTLVPVMFGCGGWGWSRVDGLSWLFVEGVLAPRHIQQTSGRRRPRPPPCVVGFTRSRTFQRPAVLVEVRRDGGDAGHAEVPRGQGLPQLLEEGEKEAAKAGVHCVICVYVCVYWVG